MAWESALQSILFPLVSSRAPEVMASLIMRPTLSVLTAPERKSCRIG